MLSEGTWSVADRHISDCHTTTVLTAKPVFQTSSRGHNSQGCWGIGMLSVSESVLRNPNHLSINILLDSSYFETYTSWNVCSYRIHGNFS